MAESLQNLDPIGVAPPLPDGRPGLSAGNGAPFLSHITVSPEALRALPAEPRRLAVRDAFEHQEWGLLAGWDEQHAQRISSTPEEQHGCD